MLRSGSKVDLGISGIFIKEIQLDDEPPECDIGVGGTILKPRDRVERVMDVDHPFLGNRLFTIVGVHPPPL